MSYNGWTNHETWLVNVWLGDTLNDMQEEGQEISPDYIRDLVQEIANDGAEKLQGFILDMLNSALSSVNWNELAEHYKEEDQCYV